MKRIKSSGILEMVIAMVMIITVLGIGLMIFTNVTRFSASLPKIRAGLVLQQLMLQEEKGEGKGDENVRFEDFSIVQEHLPYPLNSRLQIIRLTAYDLNHKQLAELKKVIFKNEAAK